MNQNKEALEPISIAPPPVCETAKEVCLLCQASPNSSSSVVVVVLDQLRHEDVCQTINTCSDRVRRKNPAVCGSL